MYKELLNRLRICEYMAVLTERPQYWKDIAAEAADAIEELQRQIDAWVEPERKALIKSLPRWIPVTERCPEKSGDYLVVDDCRNLYVNEWHCLLKKWQYDDSRITHWMPLPSTEGLNEA